MKKLLMSILIVLVLILIFLSFYNGINIGFIKIPSIKQIKEESATLDENLQTANELSNKTYPEEVEGLEEAIRQLKISKQEYENKKAYSNNEEELGTIEIKTYTIHYLWTILGNYRKDRGVESLNLDLKSTNTEDVYDLAFTLKGKYTSITDFLYDIEDDDELNFEIKDFSISSNLTEETTTEETDNSGENSENNTNTSNNVLSKDQTNNTTSTTTRKK